MQLEKEFRQAVEEHKYNIIASALMVFENEGIYNHPLLREFKNYKAKEEKAFEVVDMLLDRKSKELYNAIYEVCWNKMKHVICDTKAYGIPESERSKPLGELQ